VKKKGLFLVFSLGAFFSVQAGMAASTEDFNPGNLSADERVVIGSVKVIDGEDDITYSCRVCFRADLSECFELGSNGTVYHKRNAGAQRITSMSCNGKEPDRVAVRGFSFAVDPRPGVATYFGNITLKGSFDEKLFQVDTSEDRYASDVTPFHRKFGNRLAVRYVRSIPPAPKVKSGEESVVPQGVEAKNSTELPQKERERKWFFDLGFIPFLRTKYTDSTNIQSTLYDQKDTLSGYSRTQYAAEAHAFFRPSAASSFLLGGGLLFASDQLKMDIGTITQNLFSIGPSARFYLKGAPDGAGGVYLRSDLGLAKRMVTAEGFSSTNTTLTASSDIGFTASAGLGAEVAFFRKAILGISGQVLLEQVKSDGDKYKSRRYLVGVHVLF
jgi:hypothetical protein